jgi:hypothetical protein
VVPQALQSKGAVKLSELSVVALHRQPVPVRVSVAAAQSKGNRDTVSLARHLGVQAPARREAEKSVDNLAPINLQPRRLPVRVRAKREAERSEANRELINLPPHRLPAQARARREAEESVDKRPMVNRPGSQEPERQLRLSKGRGNPQRKKERGLRRRGHNNLLIFAAAPG